MSDTLPTIIPAKAALLVMDYQQGIVGSLPDSKTLLSSAARAIALMRERGGHVGYVRVAFEDADFAKIPPQNKMAARIKQMGNALHSDSPATAIPDEISPQPGDIVVRKTRVGAFSTTNLDSQLRERGITTLILAGIATSGVVLSTVREAADRDYQVFVLADATADTEPDVHEFLMTKIFPRQADVITMVDLETLSG